jgi:hypothetical protein
MEEGDADDESSPLRVDPFPSDDDDLPSQEILTQVRGSVRRPFNR